MRPVLWIACLSLAASVCAAQQSPSQPKENECCAVQSSDGSTAVTPQQLRRVEPPPEHASAAQLEAMGDDLRSAKSYADALDYYRAAMQKDPRNAVLYNKSGITQLKLLRYREAKRDFQRAIRLQRDYAEAHNNLGVVEYINRKYRSAVRHYRKAVELRPLAASFHSNLGTAHFARKEYDRAGEAYLRALELDPEVFERQAGSGVSAHLARPQDRARYAYTIAKMHAQLGDTERCLLYLRRAMEDGFPQIDNVYREKEFAQVREDPRFEELMAQRPVPIP
jgi:tetratricopeptide (TPR) repeat protein